MPCYHPLQGYRSRIKNAKTGKRGVVFTVSEGYRDMPIQVPCGQCIGCRLERSRQWAIRCMHEAQLHESNCFITLTYNDQHLPEDNSLKVDHFQKFMKRLRKKFGQGIRFYHCGEYGEQFKRPHYHAIIFGLDFADKQYHRDRNGYPVYVSQTLQELWPYGFSEIGTVTFESAAYVARYITKKVTGEQAQGHYGITNYETGEFTEIKPEYTTMSRRPGIGKNWLEKYHKDIYPDDFVVVGGKKMKPPKFYDAQFEIAYPSDFDKIKAKRISKGKQNWRNNTTDRLRVREYIQKEKFKKLPRRYESD